MKRVALGTIGLGLAAAAILFPRTGVGQTATPDYYPMNSRSLKLVIDYDPAKKASIRQVQLFVSRNKGETWSLEGTTTPDKEYFPYAAREDGMYWFNMMVVYTDGTKDPADVTRAPNPQKILVDATPPVVRIVSAQRNGDDVGVEWNVEEKYPNDAKTRVSWKPAGGSDAEWKDVPLGPADRRAVRFNPNTNAAVVVRVAAEDWVGNAHAAGREVAGLTTTAFASPANPVAALPAPAGGIAAPAITLVATPIVDPAMLPAPAFPAATAPVVDLTTAVKPAATDAPAPIPITPAAPPPAPAMTAIATNAGTPAPAAETNPVTAVNYKQFELPISLEAGPSGVKQIDLYATRDDGRTWQKWSQHDGRESSLRVSLDARNNPNPEGTYGFKVVAVSGAGLSDELPRAGTKPEFRVQYDITPPVITIYEPATDPANRDVLVLQWQTTDKNLGTDPVGVEWADSPNGPWKPVAVQTGLVPVSTGVADVAAARVPNTGKFPWKVPTGLTAAGVYLRVTAWDAAGNRSQLATEKPIPVDTTKPRARIQGIQPIGPRP